MEQIPTDPFVKAETTIDGVRIIIQPIDRKAGIMGVQIINGTTEVVNHLRSVFGDALRPVELATLPGASHITLTQILSHETPTQLIARLQS